MLARKKPNVTKNQFAKNYKFLRSSRTIVSLEMENIPIFDQSL